MLYLLLLFQFNFAVVEVDEAGYSDTKPGHVQTSDCEVHLGTKTCPRRNLSSYPFLISPLRPNDPYFSWNPMAETRLSIPT